MTRNAEDFWVFGYGSLMWRPDFPFEHAGCALVRGYHRALCALSPRARGTREKPGLVVGLDRGGACLGRAFRVAPHRVEEVTAYLHRRELKSGLYRPKHVDFTLRDGSRGRAYTFVIQRESPLYTGKIPLERQIELILQGHGDFGSSLEYLENTVAHLEEMEIPCETLRAVLEQAQHVFRGREASGDERPLRRQPHLE
ncbi:MAG: gamma-glutamylcyclotransferase [Rhodospirillales bacterium]